jgi:hypothetical protein
LVIKTNFSKKLMCTLVLGFVSMMVAIPSVEACDDNAITGFVWDDRNCNGEWNTNEPVISGVTVKLYYYDEYDKLRLKCTDVTGDDGKYTFSSLSKDDYYLNFKLKKGYYSFSTGVDSDVNSNGEIERFSLGLIQEPEVAEFNAGMCGHKKGCGCGCDCGCK